MKRSSQSEAQFFKDIKDFLHLRGNCEFDQYEGFPVPSTEGHPINLDSAKFALEFTAKACLGENHSVHLHSFGNSKPVGAQLLLIAAECKATPQCARYDQENLGVDVYGVFVTAYTYADDLRSLERTLSNHASPVLLQNRLLAAKVPE